MCSYRCDNGTVDNYKKHFCKVGSLHIATRRHEIMKELVINGPMMMGLIIYEDFMNYESGIYKHVDGDEIGGHAMKLIGYGHDEVEGHYWILQN
jgi:cathepsin B